MWSMDASEGQTRLLGVQLLLGGVPWNVVSASVGSIHSNEHSDAIRSSVISSQIHILWFEVYASMIHVLQ